jgi:SAM-dependent methyltransferase
MAQQHNDTAELFDLHWKRDTYAGFSENTNGERSTPFLDTFIREVKALGASAPKVVELGAGSCHHALRCALEGLATTAVEYSAHAVDAARARAEKLPGVPLAIVQADLSSFTQKLADESLAGVYANSVFHFLSADARRDQYRRVRRALVARGVLAISFKAEGDALQTRGAVVETTLAGPVIEGDDGIRRLFVADIDALAREMTDEGYAIESVIRWSVADYNIKNQAGAFVGLIARR